MAHLLTASDRMFSVREKPWHYQETGQDGRTVVLSGYPTTEEAIAAAHQARKQTTPAPR